MHSILALKLGVTVVEPFSGSEAPRAWIFGGELTGWVPVLPSFTWSILLLPRYVNLMSESLWHSCNLHNDRMDCSSRVYAVWCAWAPAVASCLTRQ
jgi:hypothetical protein